MDPYLQYLMSSMYQQPGWGPTGAQGAPMPMQSTSFPYSPGLQGYGGMPSASNVPYRGNPAASAPMISMGGNRINATGAPVAPVAPVGDAARLGDLTKQATPDPTLGYLNAGIQGAGMLGNLGLAAYGLWQSHDAMNWQKNMAENNYSNSIKSYNDSSEGRIRARLAGSGNQEMIQAEVNKRNLPERK